MNQRIFNIAGERMKVLRLFILFLFLPFVANAQTIKNLDVFYLLVDSAATETAQKISIIAPEVSLNLDMGTYYSVFENSIFSAMNNHGLKVRRGSNRNDSVPGLNFIINQAQVIYGDQERDGFLGGFFVSREVSITGSYLLTSTESSVLTTFSEFDYSYVDRVKVEDIELIENRSFPFTVGRLPDEPFFSSLLEPVIAVGAAALAVILFFSVRSK